MRELRLCLWARMVSEVPRSGLWFFHSQTVTLPVYSPGEDSWVSHSSRQRVGEAGVSLCGSSQLPAWMLTLPGLKPAVRGSQHEEGRVVPLAGRGAEAALGGPGLVCMAKILARP